MTIFSYVLLCLLCISPGIFFLLCWHRPRSSDLGSVIMGCHYLDSRIWPRPMMEWWRPLGPWQKAGPGDNRIRCVEIWLGSGCPWPRRRNDDAGAFYPPTLVSLSSSSIFKTASICSLEYIIRWLAIGIITARMGILSYLSVGMDGPWSRCSCPLLDYSWRHMDSHFHPVCFCLLTVN